MPAMVGYLNHWATAALENARLEPLLYRGALPARLFQHLHMTTRGLLATDHVILNHGQVTWTTPELAPPLLTTTPHQREDVSALDRFNRHRCPTRRGFSGTGFELVTRQAMVRYPYHSADTAARSMSDYMQRPVCYQDLKTSAQNYIHRVWQETWDQQVLNKLHSIHPSTSHWAALPVRRHDVRLTRLRIGNTRFTHRHLLLASVWRSLAKIGPCAIKTHNHHHHPNSPKVMPT
ncbi:uncharacterized protein TNCV_1205161 [Trichonephila clavipes]|nr:uncharacterized protein TNCV_1205161 [Trichonephila clavipes]